MSSDTKHAEKVAEATEGMWLAAEKTVQDLEKTVSASVSSTQFNRKSYTGRCRSNTGTQLTHTFLCGQDVRGEPNATHCERIARFVAHIFLGQLKKRALELESQSRVNAAQAGEIAAQAAEIELLRSEIFDLKR